VLSKSLNFYPCIFPNSKYLFVETRSRIIFFSRWSVETFGVYLSIDSYIRKSSQALNWMSSVTASYNTDGNCANHENGLRVPPKCVRDRLRVSIEDTADRMTKSEHSFLNWLLKDGKNEVCTDIFYLSCELKIHVLTLIRVFYCLSKGRLRFRVEITFRQSRLSEAVRR